jgi:hypothetical protein
VSEWQVSLISVWVGGILGIVGSLLGSWLSHRWEWKRRHIEENLRWLEERYQPALEFLGGSSPPMIGDWDAGRQPAVALREPMAQRGERKSMREAWWYGSVFRRDPCLIEDGVRGESPSYRNYLFVGAALAATFVSS